MMERDNPKSTINQDLGVHLMCGPQAIPKRPEDIINNQTERGQGAIWPRIKMAV